MNRTVVLDTIRNTLAQLQLQQQANRPLGEVVPLVAHRLRAETAARKEETQVVPFSVVAAFIDGQATTEEERLVCAAILVDNSVLAELIAAVRAQSSLTSEPPLSAALTDRLLALKPSPASSQSTLSILGSVEGLSQVPTLNASNGKQATPTIHLRLWSTLIAVAASIVLLIVAWGIWSRGRHFGKGEEVVQERPKQLPTVPHDSTLMPEFMQIEDRSIVQFPQADSNDGAERPLESPSVVKDKPDKNGSLPVEVQSPDLPLPPDDANQYAAQDSTSQQTDWTKVKWSRVQGLLARQESLPTSADSESQRYSRWMGSVEDTALVGRRARVRWRTFPGSQAQAGFASGGRLVLHADSEIELQESEQQKSSFTLQHGAVAFVDMPKGTDVDISYAGHPVHIQWNSKATMVLLGSSLGLQSQINGHVTVDGKAYRNLTLNIQPDATSEVNASRQLPAWITRPPEATLSRSLLQKLSESEDIEATLGAMVTAGRGLDENARSQFQLWLSTLNQDVLYRVLLSGNAPARAVGFRRALAKPLWSDTWQEFWQKLEPSLQDAEHLRVLQASVLLAQNGVRANLDQASRLVACLDSQHRAARGLADLLLRQLVGNGPAFDPDIQGPANVRQIGLWRRYVNAQQLR